MMIFIATFSIFLLAILGLSLGWLFNQKVLKGSCGGLSSIPGVEPSECSCSKPCEKRLKRMAQAQDQNTQHTQHVINRLPD